MHKTLYQFLYSSVKLTNKSQFVLIKYIMEKINARSKAKDKGDFNLADKIREELLSNGILIEDKKDKTIWKYK